MAKRGKEANQDVLEEPPKKRRRRVNGNQNEDTQNQQGNGSNSKVDDSPQKHYTFNKNVITAATFASSSTSDGNTKLDEKCISMSFRERKFNPKRKVKCTQFPTPWLVIKKDKIAKSKNKSKKNSNDKEKRKNKESNDSNNGSNIGLSTIQFNIKVIELNCVNRQVLANHGYCIEIGLFGIKKQEKKIATEEDNCKDNSGTEKTKDEETKGKGTITGSKKKKVEEKSDDNCDCDCNYGDNDDDDNKNDNFDKICNYIECGAKMLDGSCMSHLMAAREKAPFYKKTGLKKTDFDCLFISLTHLSNEIVGYMHKNGVYIEAFHGRSDMNNNDQNLVNLIKENDQLRINVQFKENDASVSFVKVDTKGLQTIFGDKLNKDFVQYGQMKLDMDKFDYHFAFASLGCDCSECGRYKFQLKL